MTSVEEGSHTDDDPSMAEIAGAIGGRRLKAIGILTLGDLAAADPAQLGALLGRPARAAHGRVRAPEDG